MGLLRKLASDTVLYGISSILARMLNYFLVFLHASALYGFPAQEFGILSELYIYVAFLMIIFTYGTETAFFRFAEKDNLSNVFNQILSVILVSTFVFSAILISFSSSIAFLLGYPEKTNFIVWLILILAIDTILTIPFARLRQEKKAKAFAVAKLVNIGINIFLNIFFLVFCKEIYQGNWLPFLKPIITLFYIPDLGIGYVFLANLLANAFLFIWLYKSFRDFRFVWDWQALKPILLYAYPLIFMGLAGTISSMIDRILLKILLPDNFYPGRTSLDAVGIYAACYKLSIFMTLAIQAFKYAAEPFFFAQAKDKNAPELFAKVMRYFVIACVLIWVAVSLNLDVLQYFYGRPEYREGILVVPILLLANLFLGVYYNVSAWFKLTDKTYFGTWISLGGAVFTLIGNALAIPLFGYMGSAWVTLLTYLGMAWACYHWGQKYYPVPYQLANALLHILIGGVLIFLGFQFNFTSLWYSVPYHFILLLLYFIFLFLVERKNFRK